MNSNRDWSPTRLSEFIGQSNVMKQLHVEIKAAKLTRRQMRHTVFGGPQGVGKTLLAKLIAAEFGGPCPTEVMGKSLTHEQLTQALLAFTSGGYETGGYLAYPDQAHQNFLIIDEAQQVSRELLNLLHPVLDPAPDGRRIFQGKHARGQIQPVWIVGFTCILITNYLGRLAEVSAPTLSRFPISFQFEWYTEEEIVKTIRQYAFHLGITIAEDALQLLARRSNGMPRAALSLLRRTMDLHLAEGNSGPVTIKGIEAMLNMVGIDGNGLDRSMVRYLKALCEHPSGRLSLQSLQAVLDTDSSTLLHCIEPILMKKGMVLRCSSGREITNTGRAALGMAGGNPDDRFFSRRIA